MGLQPVMLPPFLFALILPNLHNAFSMFYLYYLSGQYFVASHLNKFPRINGQRDNHTAATTVLSTIF